ncbi:cell division ATP-binding protein FtsE [Aestuariivirga litoralis]|uniref:Cell division ATP-binding protein FtsE n=1 Tax=Aestuariivirga litoralis TaxID=2650924 RepID=A0A2W2BV80_9HYPH|nr:cell division ATP-binding protein FtsE [Aestuariivirga litoralis]PZF77386.1 cell division ATP-binding protein FtsE [Aestuariivirga litoralis]
MLRLENVGLRYGEGPEVLRDVSFALRTGDFYFLTGPSGAGKSSLLKLLFLALKPTRGTLRIFGEDVGNLSHNKLPPIRRRIGVVFQEFRLLDHLSTYDNVALPLRVAGKSESTYRRDVMDLLDWVGLAQKSADLPPVLSGGEKQRAAIARAVIAKPQLLLADEPTGNVDPVLAKRLLHLFVELNRLGTTMLIATHDKGLVRQAERPVLHLEQGIMNLQ